MPRRRLVVLLSLALAAVLAVVAVVVTVRRSGPGTAGDAVAQDRPGPVLLVPGYGGSLTSLEPLAAALRAQGREVVLVPYAGDGTGDLRVEARRLRSAADAALAAGAPSVDVVGYSAGGVVARLWAAELGGAAQVRRVVTLGSPHHGTQVADLAAALAGAACPPACRQLVPGSDLLAALPETPRGPLWTSIWTRDDQTVTPPDSARLAGAVDVVAQQVCGDARIAHGQLPGDPLVIGLVERALAVAPMTAAPAPGECSALRAQGGQR